MASEDGIAKCFSSSLGDELPVPRLCAIEGSFPPHGVSPRADGHENRGPIVGPSTAKRQKAM